MNRINDLLMTRMKHGLLNPRPHPRGFTEPPERPVTSAAAVLGPPRQWGVGGQEAGPDLGTGLMGT